MAQSAATIAVCESCLEAIEEETGGFGFGAGDLAMVAAEFGSEVADHSCEAVENHYATTWTYDNVVCACGCETARKSRRMARKAGIVQ